LRFSAKALGRIRYMLERGTTLLFVSHNLEVVTQMCSRVIWIHAGRVQMDGPAQSVTSAYVQYMVQSAQDMPSLVIGPPPARDADLSVPQDAPGADSPRLWLGAGWYPLEAYGGDVFRWADTVAEVYL